LALAVLLHVVLAVFGQQLINAQRARITARVVAMAAVYQFEPGARFVAGQNDATLCAFNDNSLQNQGVLVCVVVNGTQRWARATDTWSNLVPTLDE
jgi:hypothetical protein